MQYCDQCHVNVRGGDSICPLCQHKLTGEKEQHLYPTLQTIYKKFQLLFKFLIAGTFSAGVICVGINLILPKNGAWSMYVVILIIDFIMGWSNWSLDYFIPIAYSTETLSLYIIARVKKLPAEEYIIYIISALLFCIVPITFYFAGLLTVVLPSIICFVLSIVTLVWLVVFEGKRLMWEFKKRFHL